MEITVSLDAEEIKNAIGLYLEREKRMNTESIEFFMSGSSPESISATIKAEMIPRTIEREGP